MKAATALVVSVSISALLLAGCGGDTDDSGSASPTASATSAESKPATASPTASPTQAGQTTGEVGATLTTASGVAVTLKSIGLPGGDYDPLGEERAEGNDPIQGYRAVLNAQVRNGATDAVTLTPADVTLDFFTSADANGQGGGEKIACEQVFAATAVVADRAPGNVAPGAEAAWTSTFVCPGQRRGTEVVAVYTVGGEQLTFSGELP